MHGRVVVAMSGGVDSSVAAALLKNTGYEVIGITACFNLPDTSGKRPGCCGLSGIEDARRVAHKLGIRHYVLNMQKALEEHVIRDFCLEYLNGRTPNPCIHCNQHIKFGVLLKKALSLGAEFLATGHYARIIKDKSGYCLCKARDLDKDQSYFLYRIGQNQLGHLLFPLGDYKKGQVRSLAREFGLAVADKPASQEICFLPDMDYRKFLAVRMSSVKHGKNLNVEPGPVFDKKGNFLGRHRGIAFYTVGQRQGLGIALGYPAYVMRIDPRNNAITVGRKKDAFSYEFLVKEAHFIGKPIKKKIALGVKIRYNHRQAQAEVTPFKGKLKVRFRKGQFAVTPGQSAVFYDRDIVYGGGTIEKVLG